MSPATGKISRLLCGRVSGQIEKVAMCPNSAGECRWSKKQAALREGVRVVVVRPRGPGTTRGWW